jgi:riboflavin synthase
MQVTNLGYKKIGDKVNIETDILGKYILSED